MLNLIEENDYKTVLDLGCGCQYLKGELEEACEYTGVDLYKHCPDTIQCNFNNKEFPINRTFDLVVIAGVIEYIKHIDWFLTKAAKSSSKYILLSYNFKEFAKSPADIWLPLKNQKDIFNILFKNNFRLNKYIPDPVNPIPNTTGYMLFEKTICEKTK